MPIDRRALRPATAAPLALALALLGGCAGGPSGVPSAAFDPPAPEVRVAAADNGGAIYRSSNNRFFFEDIRARRVGDIINVVLDERTNATKSASTQAARATSVGVDVPRLFGAPVTFGGRDVFGSEIGANADFSGTGDSSQSNQLTGSVAVTVHEVLPNGLLRIRGEKVLTLNQGSEVVRVSGLVRSVDIRPGNAVLSTDIADADISYGGHGLLADTNRAGWMTRLFTSRLWPF